jgi:hypothetical protein
MIKSKIARAVALAMLTMGGLAAPTPARADIQELRECLHNCYIAYVVMTQQPAFYQMCAHNCIVLYDNFAATDAPTHLAVTRYG